MSFNFKTWEDKYLLSLYWAVVTMMTVGYGDITPTNKIEVIYTSIVILFGCVVYGYNLNTIGIVLEEMYKEAKIFKNSKMIFAFQKARCADPFKKIGWIEDIEKKTACDIFDNHIGRLDLGPLSIFGFFYNCGDANTD